MLNKFKNFYKSILYLIYAKISFKLILYFFYCKIKKIFFINNIYKKKYYSKIENIYKNFYTNHNALFKDSAIEIINVLQKYKSLKNISYLEIGSFEGSSAIFFNHYLKQSTLYCVDTWMGSDEFNNDIIDMKIVENNFDSNMQSLNDNKIIKIKNDSKIFFEINNKKFNLAFIDGDHKYKSVINDLNNTFKFLDNDGIIICDDFLWNYYASPIDNPAKAISDFYVNNKKRLKILSVSNMVIFKKI